MQDSIEDYIRISKNIKHDPEIDANVKIRKDILATAQRKEECEAYAMKIVMFFLDGKLRSEAFLNCLKFINQDYYQDIVEERAITKLCGYPLCNKKIPDMPKQKYFISSKANKVYDISDRKNYCSNFCYKGSVYVKDQIATSPLWLRNHVEMKDCKLLPLNSVGSPGEEVNQGVIKEAPELPHFTSVADFTKISLEEAEEIEKIRNQKINIPRTKAYCRNEPSLNIINEDNEIEDSGSEQSTVEFEDTSDNEFHSETNRNKVSDNKIKASKGNANTLIKEGNLTKKISQSEKLSYLIAKLKIKNEPKIQLIDLPPMKTQVNQITKRRTENSSQLRCKSKQIDDATDVRTKIIKTPKPSDNKDAEIISKITIHVEEWITIDTFIYIFGEDKVKQILDENRMGEYFDKLKITELETSQQLKYMNICKRLHMQELAEEKFDGAVVGHLLKPLPDFKQLKEDVQDLNIKVKSFYKGSLYEKQDPNFPIKPVKENENEDESSAVLPLVDAAAQNALRRKVFLNYINKALKNLIREMQLEESYILPLTRELVRSFKLQAHNTIFKPRSWTLIAVVLLKMLSLKETTIDATLNEDQSKEYLDLILSSYSNGEKIIQDTLYLFNNIEKFVESYISNKDNTEK